MLFVLPSLVNAQTVNQYSFAAGTTGTLNAMTGSTQLVAAGQDDGISAVTTIPFTFNYGGINYTQFSANSNGLMRLGATAVTTQWTNSAVNANTATPAIMPYWDDLSTGAASTSGKVHYLVTGTAPNRILIVEWFLTVPINTSGTANAKFQCWLSETTNTVQFLYGSGFTSTTGSASVGLATSTTVYNTAVVATNTSSNSVFSTTNNATISSGRTYTYTPPPPCMGTPSSGGTIVAAQASQLVCPAIVPTALVATALPSVTGLTYQWETASDAVFTTPSNVATGTGGTTTTYTPAATPTPFTTPLYFRLKVTCTASGLFAYSNVATINPPASPLTQSTAITLVPTTSTMVVGSTIGSGSGRIIAISNSATFTDPVNGSITPTTSLAYTSGQLNYYVTGTTAAATFTGLTSGTTYYVRIYEYNRCGAAAPYDYYFNTTTATGNPASQNVATSPNFAVTRTTGAAFSSIGLTGSNFSWVGGNGDDATSNALTLPSGFDFTYCGIKPTALKVCTNGWLSLNSTTTSATFSNTTLLASGIGFVIAPLFDDLICAGYSGADPTIFNQANGNGIHYTVTGSAPSRVLTVEWTGMETFGNAGPNLNYQVQLFETTNEVKINYGTIEGYNGSFNYTYSYSVGLTGGGTATTECFALQDANSTNFGSAGISSSTVGAAGALSVIPECNTSYSFVPGTYGGTTAVPTTAPANDEPANAIVVTPNTSECTSFCSLYYKTKNATATAAMPAPTVGTPDDDVWFKFNATAANTSVKVYASGGFTPVVQILDASYVSLSPAMSVAGAAGLSALANPLNLIPGQDYYVRVFSSAAGSGTDGQYGICVWATPLPPVNNDCAAAVSLAVGTACATTAGTTIAASASPQTVCAGLADDDVWYKFVAEGNINATVTVQSLGNFNAHVQVWSAGLAGDCATMTTLSCTNATGQGGVETSSLTNLTDGHTYFIRVYHTLSGSATGNFTICVQGTCAAPTVSAATGITLNSANAVFTLANNTASRMFLEYGLSSSFGTPGVGATAGGSNTVITPATSPVALSSLTAATDYKYVARQNCGATLGFSANSSELLFTTLEACSKPTFPSVGTITATSASVSWTCTGCTDPIIVEYGVAGFTPGTGATAGTGATIWSPAPTASPQVLTGLTPSTSYSVYLRKDCSLASNGYSTNTTVVSFTTPELPPANDEPCNATTLVLDAATICQNTSGATVSTIETGSNLPTVWTGSTLNNTVWFKYIPTVTAAYYLNMSSPSTSTQVMSTWAGIYTTDCAVSPLAFTQVMAPVSGSTTAGTVTVTTTPTLNAGTSYYFMIDGVVGSFGDFCIQLSPKCSAAVGLSAITTGTVPLTTVCGDMGNSFTYYGIPNGANTQYYLGINWAPDGTLSAANAAAKAIAANNNVNITLNASSDQNVGATQTVHGMKRYWNVTNVGAFDEPVNVKFFYDPAEKAEIDAIAGTKTWFKTVGSSYAGIGNMTNGFITGSIPLTATIATESGTTYALFTGLTSFSGGTYAASTTAASPLPITLKSFTATEKGAANVINWETAVETNVRNFAIEKSNDGKTWTKLGEETPSATKRYSMIDNTPFATTYYRLRNIDNDTREDVSNVVVVNRKTGKFTITSVSPNPTNNDVNLKFETTDNANVTINVQDIFGRVVLTQRVDANKGFNTVTVTTSEIPAGAYFLNVNDGTSILTQRIVKN